VHAARDYFDNKYDHGIRHLKEMYPEDHKNEWGEAYWSGTRRQPYPISFDADDSLHL